MRCVVAPFLRRMIASLPGWISDVYAKSGAPVARWDQAALHLARSLWLPKVGTEQATGKENGNRMHQGARIERLKASTRVEVWQQFLVKKWHNVAEAVYDPSSDHSS